jgi:hypothetical protein
MLCQKDILLNEYFTEAISLKGRFVVLPKMYDSRAGFFFKIIEKGLMILLHFLNKRSTYNVKI